MSHFIVTGAGGFIASHLIRRLSVLGHTVSAVEVAPVTWVDVKLDGTTKLPGVHFYQRDVCKAFDAKSDGLDHHEPSIDGVFHLAATSGIHPGRERETLRNNIMSTLAVAEFCGANDVPLVFTSSGAVYAAPDGTLAERIGPTCSVYGLSKAWGEQLIRLTCKQGSYRIVRLSNVYGVQPTPKAVIGKWIECIKNRQAITVNGDGTQARDFIAVYDVVDALVLAMRRLGPKALDVATGVQTSIGGLSGMFMACLGDLVSVVADDGPVGVSSPMLPDLAITEDEIGWAPKTTLRDGLVELFKAHGFPVRV